MWNAFQMLKCLIWTLEDGSQHGQCYKRYYRLFSLLVFQSLVLLKSSLILIFVFLFLKVHPFFSSNYLCLCKLINTFSSGMLLFFQRFAVGAVELNGALYASGGYDGKDYLM